MQANVLSNSRAQRLQLCPSLTHLTVEQWIACCTIFKHDPTKRAREDTFYIDGLLVGLFPHQAYAVYWMITRLLDNITGLFLADDMGLGKTLEFIGLWVVQRKVTTAWDEVQKCRNSPNEAERKKHLPGEQEVGSVCPTDPIPHLACPCVNGSISHQLAKVLRRGPVLILA